MSRQRTVTQIDAKPRHLLAGLVTRGLLVRRGEERRGVHDEPTRKEWAVARSNGQPPVSGPLPPDLGREGGPNRRKKGKGRQ